ncbi:peptide/nickel transport system ATP-binding protein [Paenarthrobacter nitroguajacolicus]|uniref:ABC transporter ATP-binding protein n=1 Tax=Paenarthrobacter nitroguajacolicus TaxID=211146 RepID=UPI00285DBE12|nr:ABC transporter ATP-binding protein [Paenarthrobacter nitroguajacolicus]MDR6989191.1 peptide/nickel transport system ATP-binding protein [Paenarthrobacter nitroguajacolicus]
MTSILSVKDLNVAYRGRGFKAKPFHVVSGASFDIAPGETLSLVGESGSGKTTIGRAILGLAPVVSGSILFDGHNISSISRAERRKVAKGIQVIFQDPYSSLSPALTVEEILTEPLRANGRRDGRKVVTELLDSVGLPSDAGRRLPREFSGGQRQRIAIARALALEPQLIICDEPTSALDMSTQSRVLDLLRSIQERTNVAYLFISHDLGVVRAISDRTAVLLHGQIVELGDAEQVATAPTHPYTRRLQMATPIADPTLQRERRRARVEMLAAES